MWLRNLKKSLYGLIWPGQRHGQTTYARTRGPVTHIIILDGTMSSLVPGNESNAGLTYGLIAERGGAPRSVYYEAGLQWQDWRATVDVIAGRGINRQIRRAYGHLASRYRPGDRIFLFGYSRGAYAVRSLAGAIDQVGLVRSEHAIERNILTAYRHYKSSPGSPAAVAFREAYCHRVTPIEMVGVWDTVKALGIRLPLFWRWSEGAHAFHSHRLGPSVRRGYHALALDETREAFTPILWDCPPDFNGVVEQVWFRGAHGDIGGQLGDFQQARPLANIPLVWMLERAEASGLALPDGWRARFPLDVDAPSIGTWRGWGKLFLLRRRRVVGLDPSERVHDSVRRRAERAAETARQA